MGQLPEHLLAARILVFEDQVMHAPELAMVGWQTQPFRRRPLRLDVFLAAGSFERQTATVFRTSSEAL
jgi:hypothetical protein